MHNNINNIAPVYRLILTVHLVGLIGLSIPVSQDIFIFLIPFNLLFGLAILLWFHPNWNSTFIITSIFIYLATFFIEALGVNTGMIFGNYSYTGAFGLKIMNTPLMIGITWYLLLYCVYDITYRLSIHFIFKAISGGLLMLGYDLVLEPVAIKMPMWQWDSESVPIKNYLAWFLISFFILLIMHLLKIKYRNKVSLFMFIVQFMFMLILNFTL